VGAQTPTAKAPAATALALDPAALAIATRAGDFLREAKHFRFSAGTGYEVVQEDGEKLEFGSARHYTVQRPDHVRVETVPRAGDRRLVVFDGKSLTQVDVAENV